MNCKYRLVKKIFCFLIFYLFVHHIKSILYIILCASSHFLNYFRPLVAYLQSIFQDYKILFYRKGISIYFGIQEIDPSFSALLSVSLRCLFDVKFISYKIPVSFPVFKYQFEKYFIFIQCPTDFVIARIFFLIKFEFALRVISPRHEFCYFNPVFSLKFLWILIIFLFAV